MLDDILEAILDIGLGFVPTVFWAVLSCLVGLALVGAGAFVLLESLFLGGVVIAVGVSLLFVGGLVLLR